MGDHGYDNVLPSMHPFMAASGPSFRQGYKMRSLQSVDLYPLMCYLLQIPAQPNNGSLSNAKCLMVSAVSSEGFVVISLVVGVVIFLMTSTSKCEHVSKDQCCCLDFLAHQNQLMPSVCGRQVTIYTFPTHKAAKT